MKRTKLLSTTTLLVILAMGLALFLHLAMTVTASASTSITEYSLPTSTSIPQGITAGPDGNLWFAETKSNKIGKITPSGTVTEYAIPTSNSYPYGITTGPDGNLWFTEQIGNKIGKVTPSGTVTEYTIPTANSQPWNITTGPDGNLWFTETNGNKIAKVTTSGSFTEYPLPAWGGLDGITAGPDGNLWFTEPQGNKIGKITLSGTVTEYAIPTSNLSYAWGITTGPDGNLWFTDNSGDKISKVTPSGTFTEYPLPTGMGGEPKGITTGPDKNLWFTEYSGNIGKVTTSGTFTEYAVPTSNSGPEGITPGPDGNLWFTERNGNKIGKVLINPPVPPSAQWKSTFYFAEGYTGANFAEYACLENPNSKAADTWTTCMFPDGTSQSQYYSLAPTSRLTVDINQLVGAGKELSMRVVSTSPGIVAERPMYFNYNGAWSGGSDAVGATSPSKDWYFAEGNTLAGFDEYVTVQNPGNTTANLTFHYMVEGAGQKDVTAQVKPGSRATFKTRDQIGSNANASLFLSSDKNIVAERPMYFLYSGLASDNWTGGHDVVGANSPAKRWYFAEGTTRGGFEEWLCLQNPGSSAMTVDATYQLGAGQGSPIKKSYTVPAQQRLTVSVNREIGANKDTSVYLSSKAAFVAERPMYFLYHNAWDGGHDVIGAKAPATTWLFAEGYTGANFEEWLCLQNPGADLAHVTITYYPESGSPINKSWTVAPNSRQTVNVNNDAGVNLEISAKVTSNKPIIVERPMYFNYQGIWTGGHDVVGFTPSQ